MTNIKKPFKTKSDFEVVGQLRQLSVSERTKSTLSNMILDISDNDSPNYIQVKTYKDTSRLIKGDFLLIRGTIKNINNEMVLEAKTIDIKL